MNTYVHLSRRILLRMKNVTYTSSKKKAQILCSVFFFNRPGIEIMWKNMVQPDRQTTDEIRTHAHCMLDN